MVSTRLFNISAGVGMGLIALFGVMVFTTQQAFPFFIGNAGTFLVAAGSMEVDGFELQLGIDDNSSSSGGQLPSGVLVVDEVSISELVIEKSFNVRSVVGDTAQPDWKLRMTSASPVGLSNATMKVSGLCASSFDGEGVEIDGKGADTPTFVDDFSLSVDKVSLIDAGLQAGYVATSRLSVTDLALSVAPGGYDKPACMP